jgi:hypothetical protein
MALYSQRGYTSCNSSSVLTFSELAARKVFAESCFIIMGKFNQVRTGVPLYEINLLQLVCP